MKGENTMNEKTKDLLEDEICKEIQALSEMNIGTESKASAIDDLTKLYKLKIEESKTETDCWENEIKEKQLKEQVKDRYFRTGTAVAEILLPLMLYAVFMCKGFKFEETGTYTSTTFRNLLMRFKPTKK